MKKRSNEITKCAVTLLVMAIIFSIFTLAILFYCFVMFYVSLGSTSDPAVPSTRMVVTQGLPILFFLVFSTVMLWIVSIGLYKLKEFARKLTIIFSWCYGIFLAIFLFFTFPSMKIYDLLDIKILTLISLLVVLIFSARCLTRPKVKEQFK